MSNIFKRFFQLQLFDDKFLLSEKFYLLQAEENGQDTTAPHRKWLGFLTFLEILFFVVLLTIFTIKLHVTQLEKLPKRQEKLSIDVGFRILCLEE